MPSVSEFEFLDSLEDIFFAFDKTGAIVEWNEAAEEITGYSEEESATMTPADFFEGEDTDRILDAVSELLNTGEVIVEAELVTADGERIPYEFKAHTLPDAENVAFAGIGRDITERPQREKLVSREQTLREIYEIMADRQLSFDEQVNSLLALGRSELDTDYGTLSKIQGDDYMFEFVDANDDSIQSGDLVPLSATNCEIAASTEQTLVLGDIPRDAPEETDRAGYTEWGISCYIGSPLFVEGEVYGTLCFYDTEPRTGQFSEWEVTLVDLMSRWISYELQRERTTEKLQQQNERLERFASIVSHDLRNPLNIIGGSLELAEETGDLTELVRARDAVERTNTLIDDLLTLARSGEVIGETAEIDLPSLCARSWESVPAANATLDLATDQTIVADEPRVRQLLENLFRNAVEHGDDGVTVTIGDLPDGFYVEDDGPGVPNSDRQDVFEEEYSTSRGGTGFGLTIVEEIATAHGWDVALTESSEGGARFEFTNVSAVTTG